MSEKQTAQNQPTPEETPRESEGLTEEQIALLNAADPFAVVTTKPWEFEYSSKFLKRVAIVWIIIVMVIHTWVGAMLDVAWTGVTITMLDKLAFPGVGLVISVLSWIALSRPKIRANEDGVEVKNIIGTRFYSWVVIYGLSFPEGSRMARLELPEFEYVPVWAMQSGDGVRTVEAVKEFRALEAKYMPTD